MSCSEFLERFSDYLDGLRDADFRHDAERHLGSCPSCRRYLEVLEQGRELLASFPRLSVSEDFYPRLQHRIYHIDDGRALSRASGSRTTAATIVGIAVVFAVAAWSPLLKAGQPEVELTPIVVSHPTVATARAGLPPSVYFFSGGAETRASLESLWERSHLLFYEHSPLSERYRRSLRRTVLD